MDALLMAVNLMAQSDADRRYRESHKELYCAAVKTYARKTKKTVLNAYGNKCQCCGETEPWFLTIDHKNNDGAAGRRVGKACRCSDGGTEGHKPWGTGASPSNRDLTARAAGYYFVEFCR